MKFAIVFIFALALAPMGRAQNSGNSLIIECGALVHHLDNGGSKNDATFEMGYCFGLVKGEIGPMMVAKAASFSTENGIISPVQAARVVLKYLQAHPERLADEDDILVFDALKEAFPYKK